MVARRAISAWCLLGTVLVAGAASADDKIARAATAQQLFDEALKLMDAKRFAEACPKLARSHELAPSGGTLLNLGDCYEKNGQTASAWVSYRDAAARAATAGQKQAQAAALIRADALTAKLAHLTLTLAPDARRPGLSIKRDGDPVSNAELGMDIPVDPGVHKIEATAPGHMPWTKEVTVAQGASESAVVPVLVAEPPSAKGPATAGDPNVGSTQRTVGLVLAGTGLVAAGVGGIFGLRAFSTNDDALTHCRDAPDAKRCDPTGLSLTDDARTQAAISTVLVAVGGAVLAGGLVLFVTAPHAPSSTAKVKAAPFASASSGGMNLHVAW